MTGTLTLLNIAGAVATLLWGTHMVTTGVARGFAKELRLLIGAGLRNRVSACLAGILVTALLQSSTATALMASSFAASGYLDLASGLALMLGANIGTALIVQVLAFNVAAVAPLFILAGFLLFRSSSDRARPRNLGRALIGLGLMLSALSLLVHFLGSIETAPVFRAAIEALSREAVLAVLAAAILALAAHSSIAIVLFIVSLASAGVVGGEGALALVLGANLGAALSPVMEGGGSPAGRRLPLGNLLVRGAGVLIALPLLPFIARSLSGLGITEPGSLAVAFHVALNVALAVLVLPWTGVLARLMMRLVPEPPAAKEIRPEELPHYLDEAALATPGLALTNATLEALHMANLASAILKEALGALHTGDRALARAIGQRDQAIDRLGLAIRHYLADLGGDETGDIAEDEQERAQEVLSFILNIEHIGDIISNNLVEFASRHLKRTGEPFSADELKDIDRLHCETLKSLQLALGAFLRSDLGAAKEVLARKPLMRQLERSAVDRHFQRLRGVTGVDLPGLAEASGLFVKTLRDLRRVHSHIAALCYPLLEREGKLADRTEDPPGPAEASGVPCDAFSPAEPEPRGLSREAQRAPLFPR